LEHIAFSPNGELIASGGGFKTVYLWNMATGHIEWRLEGHPNDVMSIAFSPDSRLIACGSHGDTTVRLWDLATGAMLRRLDYRSSTGYKGIQDMAFSPDCKLIACCGTWEDDAPVQLWDLQTGQERRLGVYKGEISGLAFSSEGRLIALSSYKSNDRDSSSRQEDVKIQQWDVSGLINYIS
jgi:WD40 repeat protein